MPDAADSFERGTDAASQVGPADAAASGVSFGRDLFPIVLRACATPGCHDNRARPMTHFTDYRTREGVYDAWIDVPGFEHCGPGDSWIGAPSPGKARVRPGAPEASLLLDKLTEQRERCGPFHGRMPPPPAPRLTVEEIGLFRRWISEGARRN